MNGKQLTSLLCSLLILTPALPAQSKSGFASFWNGFKEPYAWKEVSPINLGNSSRLDQLMRAGKLYLSLQDAIALALENNLDIELQRYGPRITEAEFQRNNAGSNARIGSLGTVSTATTGGNGSQLAVVAPQTGQTLIALSLDPLFNSTMSWAHQTSPQTTPFVTGTSSLVSRRTMANYGVSKNFLTGTSATVGFNNTLLDQNSGRNDFNPSKNVNANLSITQKLLEGFGRAVNGRNIKISRNNIKVSELVFQQQVITTVAGIISMYWTLVSANEDVRVKQQALALNQKLYDDNKKQVEIGTLAPIEIIRAEAEVARSQQDLTVSETTLLQQETIMKNALSRTGVATPGLGEARIIPTDKIQMPDTEAVEPIQDLVGKALAGRPELEQSRINIESAKIGLKGTKSALLPTVDAFLNLQQNGLSGLLNTQPIPPVPGAPAGSGSTIRDPRNVDAYFLGGYGNALGQVFRRNFPDYSAGVTLSIPISNRAARADVVRDQLTLRQSEVRFQQSLNQVRVEVQNALISLQQARARYQTAVKNRVLQEQTLDAEQKKYALGASTIFFVIQAQRDLTAAQANEVAALSTYAGARNELERSTGQTLTANNIQIDEAMKGSVSRGPSAIPAVQ
ncbi:MAG TPA: TolC family protein [Bryobacteraceae bacterium]|nr:TolC family protein [Bryobacteraceae bacterium]